MLELLYPTRGMDSVEPQSRKSRLYLIACARRSWAALPGVCRAVVQLAETVYGQLQVRKDLRDEAYELAESLVLCRGKADDVGEIAQELVGRRLAVADEVRPHGDTDPTVWGGFAHLAFGPFDRKTPSYPRIPPELHSAALIREVFGNPFERVAPFNPDWRTTTVVQVATNLYVNCDFGSLPVLADALQDAGCDREDILTHLRSNTEHVRGCWVLEAILQES